MARRARYNKQGEVIMAAAAQVKIFSVPELSERTGIPYRTLHKRLANDFGSATADELKALIRVTGMSAEDLAEVFR